jgi:hypothetical protein
VEAKRFGHAASWPGEAMKLCFAPMFRAVSLSDLKTL